MKRKPTDMARINQKIRDYLISVAVNKGRPVTYSELNEDCNLNLDWENPDHRNQISKILGDISKIEHENNRPLLSSLVVMKSTIPLEPAYGFYSFAKELGFKFKDNQLFSASQMGKCIRYWKEKAKKFGDEKQ